MRRVFLVDVLRCSECSGLRRVIAFLQDPPVVRRILAHLGLPTQAPRIAQARPPPGLFDDYGIGTAKDATPRGASQLSQRLHRINAGVSPRFMPVRLPRCSLRLAGWLHSPCPQPPRPPPEAACTTYPRTRAWSCRWSSSAGNRRDEWRGSLVQADCVLGCLPGLR